MLKSSSPLLARATSSVVRDEICATRDENCRLRVLARCTDSIACRLPVETLKTASRKIGIGNLRRERKETDGRPSTSVLIALPCSRSLRVAEHHQLYWLQAPRPSSNETATLTRLLWNLAAVIVHGIPTLTSVHGGMSLSHIGRATSGFHCPKTTCASPCR